MPFVFTLFAQSLAIGLANRSPEFGKIYAKSIYGLILRRKFFTDRVDVPGNSDSETVETAQAKMQYVHDGW